MRSITSLVFNINNAIETLTQDSLERISRVGGLSPQELVLRITNPIDHSADHPSAPSTKDVIPYSEITDSVTQLGQHSLNNIKTACVVYLSPHTSIPFDSVFNSSLNFLSLKQLQTANVSDVWYVVPAAIFEDFQNLLSTLTITNNVKVFKQFESIELTPDNRITFVNDLPILRSTGTGDVFNVLTEDGTLQTFIKNGGKYLYITDLMNVKATPDSVLLGQHINSGYEFTCEVTQRVNQENGAVFCNLVGTNQLIEKFRLTSDTIDDFEWIGTGTFIVNADLNFESLEWPWHRMKYNENNSMYVQYERFLSDMTAHLKTQFVVVEREQKFFHVKSEDDLISLNNSFSLT